MRHLQLLPLLIIVVAQRLWSAESLAITINECHMINTRAFPEITPLPQRPTCSFPNNNSQFRADHFSDDDSCFVSLAFDAVGEDVDEVELEDVEDKEDVDDFLCSYIHIGVRHHTSSISPIYLFFTL